MVLRTQPGALRPLWALAYEAIARAVVAYVGRGAGVAGFYVRGGMAEGDVLYGVSDIDLVAVVRGDPARPGARRRALKARWLRLGRRLAVLGDFVELAVYEQADLADAARSPTLLHGLEADGSGIGSAAYFGPAARPDEGGVRERPGIGVPVRGWRRLAGSELRPAPPTVDAQRRRIAVWLEFQRWWGFAARACGVAPGPRSAHLCFKLVAEPLRAWLWLTDGEVTPNRVAALELARERLPEEGQAIETALALGRRLHRSPAPPFEEVVPALLRMTGRAAERLISEAAPAGTREVRLDWGGQGELALESSEVTGPLLPLVDWRALVVVPAAPDETFFLVPGDPADPRALGRWAAASARGPYPVLRSGDLLVLPSVDLWRRGMLRAVVSPLSDPVSTALARGQTSARFPELRGWSVGDWARRAVAEHRGWLAGTSEAAPLRALWMVFSAARAGLLLESVESGEPNLPLTVQATADRLADLVPERAPAIERAVESYLELRTGEGAMPPRVLGDLEEAVRKLPAYREGAPDFAPARFA